MPTEKEWEKLKEVYENFLQVVKDFVHWHVIQNVRDTTTGVKV